MAKAVSERALRDYAFRVLKSELGEKEEYGIIIPAKASDEQLAFFVAQMPRSQLEEMYQMIYGSEMVE